MPNLLTPINFDSNNVGPSNAAVGSDSGTPFNPNLLQPYIDQIGMPNDPFSGTKEGTFDPNGGSFGPNSGTDIEYGNNFTPGSNTPKPGSQFSNPPSGPSLINIPDWLKELATAGYGKDWMRSSYLKSGIPLGTQAAVQKRQLGETGFLSGASATGFAKEGQRQIDLARDKALSDLDYAIKSNNEAAKRQAQQQLEAINYQNRRMQEQWKNWSESQRLMEQQRAWALEQANRQYEAQKPLPWYEQLGYAGLKVGATLLPFIL